MQTNEADLLTKELQYITNLKGVTDLEYLVASLIVNNEKLDVLKEEVIRSSRTDIIVKEINVAVDVDDWLGGIKNDRKRISSGEVSK